MKSPFRRSVAQPIGRDVAGSPGNAGSYVGKRCHRCDQLLVIARFDTTFRLADGSERLFFDIPAGLCGNCRELYIDHGLVQLLNVASARCVFAIENDARLIAGDGCRRGR